MKDEGKLRHTTITAKALEDAIATSSSVVLKYQQPNGAYPASPNFLVYDYCWLRDGAFIADGMSRAGQVQSAERFFDWCATVITGRREHILNGGKLDARYAYDGTASIEKWESFQLDGYGTFLWALRQHAERHQRTIDQYQEAAGLVQHYLATQWQNPCYDWWEERRGIHAATLACIYAGLHAYNHPEAARVKATIDLHHERTDASLLICPLVDAVSTRDFAPMLAKIESHLVSKNGGVYRYHADTYYGGGEWPVATSMLGWYYAKIGNVEAAQSKLAWVLQNMQPNGWIAEQSHELMLDPASYQPWVNKWGQPANPLLWSQAMLLTLATELKNTI